MRYRQLGRSGLRVSEVGLGTGGQFGLLEKAVASKIVHAALDSGVNYFDTANIYPVTEGVAPEERGRLSEEMVGLTLQGSRDKILIGTKGMQATGSGPNERGASRSNLMNALDASLKRLRTDHVDLYQIHLFDKDTPFEETMRTLDDMVRSGKARYIGASQYSAWQLCRANDIADHYGWERFVSTQEHYHLLERRAEREVIPFCRFDGVGVLPYFPMANGLLSGKYKRDAPPEPGSRASVSNRTRTYQDEYATDQNLVALDKLTAFCAERGHALPDLAVAWLLTEPSVSSVIAGVSKVEQLLGNVRAAEWRLSEEETKTVRAVLEA